MMWYEKHLQMREDQNVAIRFLLWVGFVKFGRKSNLCNIVDGQLEYVHPVQIIWPFSRPSMPMFRYLIAHGPRVYIFRNKKGVISRLPSRLLPVRWGFGICGFEFGDRGA